MHFKNSTQNLLTPLQFCPTLKNQDKNDKGIGCLQPFSKKRSKDLWNTMDLWSHAKNV